MANSQINNSIATDAVRILLQTGALQISPYGDFGKKGQKSPILVDCNMLLAFPHAMREIMRLLCKKIIAMVGYDVFDGIVGCGCYGTIMATMIAQHWHLSMGYAGGGKNTTYVESVERTNYGEILLVSDFINHEKNISSFVADLHRSCAYLNHFLVIFHDEVNYKESGIKLHSLINLQDVLFVLKNGEFLTQSHARAVESFLDNPSAWQSQREKIIRHKT